MGKYRDDKRRSDDVSHIKNKVKRAEVLSRVKVAKSKAKKETRKREEEEAKAQGKKVERAPQKTLETLRQFDDTLVEEGDSEVEEEVKDDEFARFFAGETPRTVITTARRPSKKMIEFIRELLEVFPGSFYYERKGYELKKICEFAAERSFTNIFVLDEKGCKPRSLIAVHLPEGPTATFKISNVKLRKHLHSSGVATRHKPELILHNFVTSLGYRLGRMMASWFPQSAQFEGRRVVTFHNQRDFIFFRHHRYAFRKEGQKAVLQELGPRFTLKLRSLQEGTFDTKMGELEFAYQKEMGVEKRKFQL